MAQAYLQGLHYGSELHPRTPLTDTESEGHLSHSHSHQQQEHERPCPLQDLLLPAAAAADVAAAPEGVEMREVGGQLLQGDAQQMAQVRGAGGWLQFQGSKQWCPCAHCCERGLFKSYRLLSQGTTADSLLVLSLSKLAVMAYTIYQGAGLLGSSTLLVLGRLLLFCNCTTAACTTQQM